MMRNIIMSIMAGLFALSCGSSSTAPGSGPGRPLIFVSILPQKYFVQRIAGGRFDIDVMIPPGHNPAIYAPTPKQMRILSRAKLYFRIGHLPFETAWMKNIAANAAANMKIVDTSAGVELIKGELDMHMHNHGSIDPHTWLSPRAVKIQAGHILAALIELDPGNSRVYRDNYSRFVRDIEQLDREIAAVFKKYRKKKFMVFHPAWSYFARDYGLEQIPIEIEGKSPSPGDLKKTMDIAGKEGIRFIFVQKQFDTASARAVADEIKARVITIDPLALDWLDNMKDIARTIAGALEEK